MSNYVPLHRKGHTTVIMGGGVVPRATKSITPAPAPVPPTSSFMVRLYHTVIVTMHEGKLTLDTGGYATVTTRARMNQFLRDYLDAAFTVGVTRGQMYLTPKGHNVGIPFDRRITVDLIN